MKKTMQFHVFTHNCDEWFDQLYDARKLYSQWAKEYGSARLYIETYINDELDSEDCVASVGEYPW